MLEGQRGSVVLDHLGEGEGAPLQRPVYRRPQEELAQAPAPPGRQHLQHADAPLLMKAHETRGLVAAGGERPQDPAPHGLLHIGQAPKGVAVVPENPGGPGPVQGTQRPVKGGQGQRLRPQIGGGVADLAQWEAPPGLCLLKIRQLMAHEKVAVRRDHSQQPPCHRRGGCGHHVRPASPLVEEDAPLPGLQQLGAPPPQRLQQIGVQHRVPAQIGLCGLLFCHGVSSSARGRRITKLVRLPSLSARMEPPWRSTISRAMARPSPAPPVRVERA